MFRSWLLTSSQLGIDPYYSEELQDLSFRHPELLILDQCDSHNYSRRCEISSGKKYHYPQILHQSTFCLVFRGERMGQFVLMEAMAANCIPVIVIDGAVLPFSNVIDWKRAAIFVMEDYLNTVMNIIKKISKEKTEEMQKQVKFLYDKYFSSLKAITDTTLDIIQDRVYPHWTKTYDDWNLRPEEVKLLFIAISRNNNLFEMILYV